MVRSAIPRKYECQPQCVVVHSSVSYCIQADPNSCPDVSRRTPSGPSNGAHGAQALSEALCSQSVQCGTFTCRLDITRIVYLYSGRGGGAGDKVDDDNFARGGGDFATSRNPEASNTLLLLGGLRTIPAISVISW